MVKVIIGVDPHKLSATIEVVDRHEKLLGSGRFRTDQAGYTEMRAYAKAWPEQVWRSSAATAPRRPLAQRLLEAGEGWSQRHRDWLTSISASSSSTS